MNWNINIYIYIYSASLIVTFACFNCLLINILYVTIRLMNTIHAIYNSFGDDLVPDTDTGLLFHFSHHCGIGDFKFISISHSY